ncbi:MAG: hypothetical protein HC784_01500 [Hydrococcus sp. CSU_1_8]|nr:hypothetical protein [Hydrococcus sp. CSU_1_8]
MPTKETARSIISLKQIAKNKEWTKPNANWQEIHPFDISDLELVPKNWQNVEIWQVNDRIFCLAQS